MDEIFETVVLIQTNKIERFPIIVMGKDFWRHMQTFVDNALIESGTIDAIDMDLIQYTDDPEEAVEMIARYEANGNGNN